MMLKLIGILSLLAASFITTPEPASYIVCSTVDCYTYCYKCSVDSCQLISTTPVDKCGNEGPPVK